MQVAIDNVVITDGEADVTDAAFKVGCKANGHVWDAGTVVKEAVGSSDGAKKFVCQECKAVSMVTFVSGEDPVVPTNPPTNDPTNPQNPTGGSDATTAPTSNNGTPDKNNPNTAAGDLLAIAGIVSCLLYTSRCV